MPPSIVVNSREPEETAVSAVFVNPVSRCAGGRPLPQQGQPGARAFSLTRRICTARKGGFNTLGAMSNANGVCPIDLQFGFLLQKPLT